MMATLLEARRIEKRIGHRTILNGVDMVLEAGRIMAFFGPNGAGKSTLAKILSLVVKPTAGELFWEGRPVGEGDVTFRAQLGVVGHQSFLYDNLTAEENLHLYGRLYGVTDFKRRTEEVLDLIGLSFFARDTVGTFSRGMQQRMSVARAIMHRPRLLLMDEPFTGLDQQGQALLHDILAEFRDGGGSCLLISHDFSESLALADDYAVLSRGRVVALGEVGAMGSEDFHRVYLEALGASAG